MQPRLTWALCTTARSGSTWLSQLISSTHLLGYPDEYLLEWPRRAVSLGLSAHTPLEQYLGCLLETSSTSNGVFAIKGALGELQPFFELFPTAPCVWLTRQDKLAQAVSWHRAHDGGLWHRANPLPARPFEFSADRALWFYDEILRREAQWQSFFASHSIQPLHLTYERLCENPLASIHSIASHIGIDPTPIVRVTSQLQILRDDATPHHIALLQSSLLSRQANLVGQRIPLNPPTPASRSNP
jgi:LPS sulfotransferase NodH